MTRKRVRKKKQKFTTTIYFQRMSINEHREDILSVPWSDLSRKNVHSNEFGICFNDSGYPSQKTNCYLFEWLGLSV